MARSQTKRRLIALVASLVWPLSLMAQEPPKDWLSQGSRNHPLVGTIWSAREGKAVSPDDLKDALAKSRFVLLGEVHDNPDHHRLQAWGLGVSASGGGKSAVAFEMLNAEQGAGLESFGKRAASGRTPDAFAADVGWEKGGWPPFAIYRPILAETLRANVAPVPASPSRERNRAVSKQGFAALGEAETKRLGLDQPLDAALLNDLAAEIEDAHCGLFPKEAIPRMSEVQNFRDATMADALLKDGKGAILIAGDGHVRRDRGAPLYLERRGVAAGDIVSVMHVEVADGKTDPAAYVPRTPDGAPAADYLWFTPVQERGDPCEGLREKQNTPTK